FHILLPPRSTLFPYTTLFRSFGFKETFLLFTAANSAIAPEPPLKTRADPYTSSPTLNSLALPTSETTPAKSPPTVVGNSRGIMRSEEHTSELQSQSNLVCRLL